MRTLLIFVLLSGSLAPCADDPAPLAVAQKLFDAMKAHDAASASALFVPGATLGSISEAGKATIIPFEKFAEHIGAGKSSWVERIWDPKVLQHGAIAVVWANYDFHLDGKLSHCGIDSFQMLKTDSGWKIASVTDTRETSGCTP